MADPVTIGLVAMAAGSAIGATGGMMADKAQADAEEKNAEYYRKQAGYSSSATDREVDIFKHEVDDLLGRQMTAFGKAGIDMSGSPLLLIGQTQDRAKSEIEAIREKGRQNVELTLLRAQSAEDTAHGIRKAAPLKLAGGLLGGAGAVMTKSKPSTPTAGIA